MTISIRPALLDEASQIAPLIYEAIGDIAHRLTGEDNPTLVLAALTELVARTDNRHSYKQTHVALKGEHVVGIIVLYDGVTGNRLDENLQQWLKQKNAKTLMIDVEAHADEYYIDTICVAKEARGQGIGTQLLCYAEQQARTLGYDKLSLNVELEKKAARKLYEHLDFVITEPWTIIEEPFHHMVKELH